MPDWHFLNQRTFVICSLPKFLRKKIMDTCYQPPKRWQNGENINIYTIVGLYNSVGAETRVHNSQEARSIDIRF